MSLTVNIHLRWKCQTPTWLLCRRTCKITRGSNPSLSYCRFKQLNSFSQGTQTFNDICWRTSEFVTTFGVTWCDRSCRGWHMDHGLWEHWTSSQVLLRTVQLLLLLLLHQSSFQTLIFFLDLTLFLHTLLFNKWISPFCSKGTNCQRKHKPWSVSKYIKSSPFIRSVAQKQKTTCYLVICDSCTAHTFEFSRYLQNFGVLSWNLLFET